jgi:hypothetical protein
MGVVVLLACSVLMPFIVDVARSWGIAFRIPFGDRPLEISYGEIAFLLLFIVAGILALALDFRPVKALIAGFKAPSFRVRLTMLVVAYVAVLVGLIVPYMVRGMLKVSDLPEVLGKSFIVFLVFSAFYLFRRPRLKGGRIDA